jgi:hypothetical protein
MKLKHYFILGALAFILIGSFFLPNAVAGIADMRRLDNLTIVDSQRIDFDTAPELGLLERISLASSSNAEIMPLSAGNAMDFNTAKERALKEVERFFLGNAFGYNFKGYAVEEGAASLVIDALVPSLNMIVWEFVLVDQSDNTLTVTIDDETGVILRLVQRWRVRSDSPIETLSQDPTERELFAAALWLADMMTSYYGLPTVLADYQFSGSLSYYRADISQGGIVIPMYGVVRATSFTINERV